MVKQNCFAKRGGGQGDGYGHETFVLGMANYKWAKATLEFRCVITVQIMHAFTLCMSST